MLENVLIISIDRLKKLHEPLISQDGNYLIIQIWHNWQNYISYVAKVPVRAWIEDFREKSVC
ncbi:hypothetical protein BpHYR1_022506 [Brachionus plicatilis]|uniref:Uncharacterized protein n=1 Tax=Brachionus plicatilis TaxID=10195 RepID=A0A3M7R3U4_BRAPC|nr:hypothetical protein BpHYR1_022506 [Brachionus plicatilis]